MVLPSLPDLSRLASLGAVLGGPVSARLTREASAAEGGPPISAILKIETSIPRPPNAGGGLEGWNLWLNPGAGPIEAFNVILGTIADSISDAGRLAALVRNAFADKRAADEARERAEKRLRDTLTGRAIRGRFLVQLEDDGRAWLQDPERGDRGFGLRFASLAELWRTHPDLRPVEWSGGRLIVESFAMVEGP